MSVKGATKKKGIPNSTASTRRTKKVVETDEMIKRIFDNALEEMLKRQLALLKKHAANGVEYDVIFIVNTVGNDG